MNISEVINKLQEIKEEHGDLKVISYYIDIDKEDIIVYNFLEEKDT